MINPDKLQRAIERRISDAAQAMVEARESYQRAMAGIANEARYILERVKDAPENDLPGTTFLDVNLDDVRKDLRKYADAEREFRKLNAALEYATEPDAKQERKKENEP